MDDLLASALHGRRTIYGLTFDDTPIVIDMSVAKVAHGMSAKIYKGEMRGNPPRVVAVKDFGVIVDVVQEKLLRQELRAARVVAMRHRYILAFIGTAVFGQHQAIVSPYMHNGNMLDYLKKFPGRKTKLILQVAEAVNYLHTVAGLVHGDLKCANVLISDRFDALLADFGLSTFIEKSGSRTLTEIRAMNTLAFAAPELLLGEVDPMAPRPSKTRESDVYAFGMLILEAVTGNAPFAGLNHFAIISRVCSGKLPPRPLVNGFIGISSSWWEVVMQRLTESGVLPVRQLFSRHGAVCTVAYMPCGTRLISCSEKAIEIHDLTSGRSLILNEHPPYRPVAVVCPNGSEIASSGRGDIIQRWNAASGAPLGRPMRGHTEGVICIAYSPDGTRIISGSDDCTIRLWDVSTGQAIGLPLVGHTGWVRSVAFSPDGRHIASASNDWTIRIWDSLSCQHRATLRGHSDAVTSVCYVPGGNFIISGSWDCTVRMWNATTLQLVRTMREHSSSVRSVAVSPSGTYIASGSADKTIRIWDGQTGTPVGGSLTGHKNNVLSVAFSPDERSLVSGSEDGTARIWELFE